MAEKPRGFFAQAQQTANLEGTHAFLTGHHEVRCRQPLVEWDLASLVERPNSDGERLAASVTLVETRTMGRAFHEGGFVYSATVRTDGAIGPEAILKPLTSLGFIVKDGV